VVSYQFLIREQMLISLREQTTENFAEETIVKSNHYAKKTSQRSIRLRFSCIDDLPIKESDHKFHWRLIRA
jgi:hypothetical protein